MPNRLSIEHHLEHQLLQQHEKNISYLKGHYPELYGQIQSVNLTQIKLNINKALKSVDIIHQGIPVYKEDAKPFAEKEVDNYYASDLPSQLSQFAKETSAYPRAGHYKLPRFFYRHLESVLAHTEWHETDLKYPDIRDISIPTLVVIGCGLGYHIEKLTQTLDIYDLAIFENNLELFYASLYTVDWTEIGKTQSAFGKKLSFYIGNLFHTDLLHGYIWNHLIKVWPSFPVMPCTYIHNVQLDNPITASETQSVIDRILSDRKTFMCSWGSYDDEINQVNQAVHNIRANKNLLLTMSTTENISELPVCIIGSGPSLDERIDVLQALGRSSFLISCGSAITALYEHGIQPDLHVELESDILMTVAYLQTIDDKSYLKRIPLLASAQVNPEIMDYFNQTVLFIKQESTIGAFPFDNVLKLDGGSPTCTNTGVRFAILLGFKKILLFGMDLGYSPGKSPHALSTAYYNKRASSSLSASDDLYARETTLVPGIHSDIIVPKVLGLALFRLQNVIRDYQNQGFTVWNCSDGVNIGGTQWLSVQDTRKQLENFAVHSNIFTRIKQKVIDSIFNNTQSVELGTQHSQLITSELKKVYELLEGIYHPIKKMIDHSNLTHSRHFIATANEISFFLEHQIKNQSPIGYRLLRCSLRHFCYVGLCYSLQSEYATNTKNSSKKTQTFLQQWKTIVLHFLKTLPRHMHDLLLDSDNGKSLAWVNLSIYDEEPNLHHYIKKDRITESSNHIIRNE